MRFLTQEQVAEKRRRAREERAQLSLTFPVKPCAPEPMQLALPGVSFARAERHFAATVAGPMIYGPKVSWIVREMAGRLVDFAGPELQTLVIQGATYHAFICVRPHGDHPGWANLSSDQLTRRG